MLLSFSQLILVEYEEFPQKYKKFLKYLEL
jgi:hypothetical protein